MTRPAVDRQLPEDRKDRVAWTTQATDISDLARRYDEWSASYEQDLTELDGYGRIVAEAAHHVAALVPAKTQIVELGCGTGLVGKALSEAGFGNLKGFDVSAGMLDQAASRGHYRYLTQADLNVGIPLPDGSVAMLLAVGTLTYLEPAIVSNAMRVLAPGGIFLFSYQPTVHRERGFADAESRLLADGMWDCVLDTQDIQPLPVSYPTAQFRFRAWQRTGES